MSLDMSIPKWHDIIADMVAEMIGTTFMVLFGCMAGVDKDSEILHFQYALAFGMAVMAVITAISDISQCHLNPCVTICAVLYGTFPIKMAPFYFISQMVGALIGYGLLKYLLPGDLFYDGLCVTSTPIEFNWLQGFLIEFLASSVLILVCCGVWDTRSITLVDSIAIKFGFTITSIALIAGPYTGCSMNPARSFAPAVYNQMWRHHSIYWLGPCLAGVLATCFYMMLYGRPHKVIRDEETELGNTGSIQFISN